MAITQSKKQSDLEKRLRLLRQQVYGRGSENSETQKVRRSENLTLRYSDTLFSRSEAPLLSGTPSRSESFRTDITYLRQDLLKIFILASSALGIQAILFYLFKNHTLNLNLF